MIELTQELLKEWFDYNDGKLYWRKTKSNIIKGSLAGAYGKRVDNRRTIRFNSIIYPASRLIFLWHHGYLPNIVDHKDRDPTNDRIENLRPATKSQNAINRIKQKNTSSKYLGVCIKGNKWQANITVDKNTLCLGTFSSEIEAAKAYNAASLLHFKEYASLNILD